MADISLTDYSSQLAANARQQRMAELLQQQAMEPIQVMSAGGVPAPIPWTAVLAKALQSGAGVYASNRADKRAAKIKAAQDADVKRNVAELLNPTRVAPGVRMEPERLAQLRAMAEKVDPTPVRAAPFDTTGMVPTAGILAGAPQTSAAMVAALQKNVPAPQPQPATAPLVTALGGTPTPAPTAMPSPVAMPPTGNPALQGNGEGMNPRAIAALRAENMRNQGPITPMAEPLVGVEGQSELDRPKTDAERQSEAVQAMLSGNAALAAVGSNFYERGAKREEKAYDTKELTDKIDSLKLDGQTTSILKAAATFGGGESVAAALVKSMTPDELTGTVKQHQDAVKLGLAEPGVQGFIDFNNVVNPRFINQGYGIATYNARDLVKGNGAAPNLDSAWNQIKKQEGGLGPNGEFLVSPKGAVGPSQMLPSTGPEAAKMAGLQWDPNKFRTDAAYNEALGKAYYASRVAARNGDFAAAALDYHTGATKVNEGKIGPQGQQYLRDFQTAFAGGGQQLRPIIQGEAKPTGHQASGAEKAAFEYKPTDKVWINADGKPELIGGQKPATEGQKRAATLTYRMLEGNKRLNDLAKEGIYGPSSPVSSLFKKSDTGLVTIALKTEQDRRYIQAIREFLAPILRYDSGAAVPDSEVLSYMETYGGKFEDSPKVKWQKAQGRTAQIRAMVGSTKDVYEDQYGEIPKIEVLTDPRGRPAGAAAPAAKSVGRAPPGVDQKVWEAMTPQGRSLWPT